MEKIIRLKNFSAENLVRLVYLGEDFPKNFTSNYIKIVKFLKNHIDCVRCIQYTPDDKETYVHIELPELSPSDLQLVDSFSIDKSSC